MSKRQLYHLWDFISRVVSAIPPIAVALYYYPIWIKTGSRPMVSGTLVIVACLASIPFFKKFKSILQFVLNASMPVLWLIGALLSYVFMNISDQMLAICCAGLAGSGLSALVCLVRNKYADEDKKETQKE